MALGMCVWAHQLNQQACGNLMQSILGLFKTRFAAPVTPNVKVINSNE